MLGFSEITVIAQEFQHKSKVPHVIGAIDGTHITVLPPPDWYRDYVNRKGWPSLVLQAVVDSMGKYVYLLKYLFHLDCIIQSYDFENIKDTQKKLYGGGAL